MQSPFPGMDPYLEAPALWPDVHHGLISEMQAALNRRLRPQYHVRVEERVYISDENDPGRKAIIPDLKVVQKRGQEPIAKWPEGCSALSVPDLFSAIAVAEPLVLTTLIEEEIHEARLEVFDTNQQSVVTVIELLSPTNKIAGSRGRASYEQKRREVMPSSSHFVEIDLLRDCDHLHTRELLPAGDYFVHVSRKDRRPKGYVWPILLPQRLPVIGIPLKEGDGDVELDLQSVLATAYDRAAYDLQIDYRQEPTPPLSAKFAEWARGLRS
ncbi:MAG: DUF4058 family protein [Planctomycetaceae bacterium]